MMINRETDETQIRLDLEGSCISVTTGIKIFDHYLSQMARHGKFKLEITATGDNEHHIVEDVGICLGQVFLETKKGRVGYSVVPMDDALVMAVVDFSDRGYSHIQLPDCDMVSIFFRALAREGRFNIHIVALYGYDSHHIAEAAFKALGRALRMGCEDSILE